TRQTHRHTQTRTRTHTHTHRHTQTHTQSYTDLHASWSQLSGKLIHFWCFDSTFIPFGFSLLPVHTAAFKMHYIPSMFPEVSLLSYYCVCVCVCARVRACVCACMHGCVCVCV